MLSEQELIRRESLQKLIDYGINPYPAQEFNRSHFSSDIKENFNEGEKVIIAGRLLRKKQIKKKNQKPKKTNNRKETSREKQR
jgi:lysyl-tRNA synthetase class II